MTAFPPFPVPLPINFIHIKCQSLVDNWTPKTVPFLVSIFLTHSQLVWNDKIPTFSKTNVCSSSSLLPTAKKETSMVQTSVSHLMRVFYLQPLETQPSTEGVRKGLPFERSQGTVSRKCGAREQEAVTRRWMWRRILWLLGRLASGYRPCWFKKFNSAMRCCVSTLGAWYLYNTLACNFDQLADLQYRWYISEIAVFLCISQPSSPIMNEILASSHGRSRWNSLGALMG